MAARKKEDMPNMIETFKEFKDTKKIDRATLVSVLEESFRSVIAKIFGSDENFDVIVNPDKGDFEIYRNRIVVADGEVKDEYKEVSLTDAQKIEPDYEVGEEVSERIDFAKFGRRAILNLRQTLAAKVLELEGNPRGIGLTLWRFNIGSGSHEAGERGGVASEWRRTECFLDSLGNWDWSKHRTS